MAAPTAKIKTTLLPLFIVAKHLPTDENGEIYGLELKRAMEDVIGKRSHIECIQKVNGLWRLILWEKRHRDLLLQTGLNIRGFTVTHHNRNPYLGKNGEEQVRLIISNVPYSIASEEIIKSLDSIGVTVNANDIQWENYRDEERNMLGTKTGRRFIFIDPPTTPLPTKMQVAGKTIAYLNYKGMQKKTQTLGFRARHGSESQSDESESETETEKITKQGKAAAIPTKTVVSKPQKQSLGDSLRETGNIDPLTGQNVELIAGTSNNTDTENQSLPKVSQSTIIDRFKVTPSSNTLPSSLCESRDESRNIELFKTPTYPLFARRSRSVDKKSTYDSDRDRSESLKRPSDKATTPKSKKARRKLPSASGKALVSRPRPTPAATQDVASALFTVNKEANLSCCIKYRYDWYEMRWVYT